MTARIRRPSRRQSALAEILDALALYALCVALFIAFGVSP